MAKKDLDNIFAVLHKKAEDVPEKAPMAPFVPKKDIREKAPQNFEYELATLVPPDDARKIVHTIDALEERSVIFSAMDNEFTEMRVQNTQKIKEMKQAQGFDKLQQEMTTLRDKLATEVESKMDEVENALIEHNNTLMTIVNTVTKGKVSDTEIKGAMIAALNKYASPEVSGQILADVDTFIAEATKAKEVHQRRLQSWPSPQDLRKKVKTEQASVTAGVMDIVQSVVDSLKGVWDTVKDSFSSLLSSVEQAQPVVDEMKGLLAESSVEVATSGAIDNVLSALGER